MRNTLQRPPAKGATVEFEAPERVELEPRTHPRRPVNTAWIVAAIVGFVLASVTVAVLVSGDGTGSEEVAEPTIAQRDLAPAQRPRETDLIVFDMAGLDPPQPEVVADGPASWGWGTWELEPSRAPRDLAPPTRPRETDVIVFDMAGLGPAQPGGDGSGPIERPREADLLIPQ
jgi:hypothetical protein